MPKTAVKKAHKEISLNTYDHVEEKRLNNPPVGLVTTQTDKTTGKTLYQYDPHIDPQLQWTGKVERSEFEVPNVSLHIHERIDTTTIAKSFIKAGNQPKQVSLFEPVRATPFSKAIHFYTHEESWSNRIIAGDSLLVMNSLLYKEGMAGKVQMIYIDPPYGVKYNSNFQPFTNKRDVKDGNDGDLPGEPETLKAFRDTWELGLHSYLTYLRDRLLLARELLTDSGSCFVQISDENVHHVRNIMDEVFGKTNYVVEIIFTKTGSQNGNLLQGVNDYIIWYAKDVEKIKYRNIYDKRDVEDSFNDGFNKYINETGEVVVENKIDRYKETWSEIDYFRADPLQSANPGSKYDVYLNGEKFYPKKYWKTSEEGMKNLLKAGRIVKSGNNIAFKRLAKESATKPFSNLWTDTGGAGDMVYVVQTTLKPIQRCMLMATDPGDLVFDPTCGSGTTACVAEEWGRRWITCDTSRVAIALAKQRLMTAQFNYYQLAHPDEGIKSGFFYKKVPHVTLGSIANNAPPDEEVLYDQPYTEKEKVRCTGPFTLEAVPAIRTLPFNGSLNSALNATDLTKTGSTALYQKWIDELKSTGIRVVGGRLIEFARVSHKEGSTHIHAEGEILEDNLLRKANIVFGGEFGPLEQRTVELALKATMEEKDRPEYLIFAAFQFDPEAAKDIDQLNGEIEGLIVLKAQMNIDLLTEDLRKKRSSNQSYWLIGQPAIDINKIDNGKYQVRVRGFDYYNPATGEMDGGGVNKIAMWELDTDYDDRSLCPNQIFFPQQDDKRDWTKLAKALNGTVDQDLLEFFSSDTSLPFDAGQYKKVAVKIIDNRGIESLVIKELR